MPSASAHSPADAPAAALEVGGAVISWVTNLGFFERFVRCVFPIPPREVLADTARDETMGLQQRDEIAELLFRAPSQGRRRQRRGWPLDGRLRPWISVRVVGGLEYVLTENGLLGASS
jgi:hypothetical protein